MTKKHGIIFIIIGTVLFLSAMSLFLYNQYEDIQAGQKAENMLTGVQDIINEKKSDK